MMGFWQRFDLFVKPRTYWVLAVFFGFFVMAYAYPVLLPVAKTGLACLLFLALMDVVILVFITTPVSAGRVSQTKWSLAEENRILLEVKNHTFFFWRAEVIDELPIELQVRNFSIPFALGPDEQKTLSYEVKPLRRGSFAYGKIRIFLATPLGLFARRVSVKAEQRIAVYPSIVQMKKFALFSVNKLAIYYGVKKWRRIGHSYEFEQIKDYVQGDDMRHLNWRATGKMQALKTNHFTDERAQPVYCVIDKSRNMNMAFDGMTLLDYAINTSLVISNTAIQKGDRAGLVTFSDKIGTALRADSGPGSLRKIMDSLYQQKYRQTEPDYEFLFNALGRVVNTRSLLFLFTNFESLNAMNRVLPVLRKINQKHLLVVILFQNSEVEKFAYQPSGNLKEVYNRMIARQMLDDKRQMIAGLSRHGIQGVSCPPDELTINALNKYIELKAKGLI
jgi:uncharacterized protein (DUF58 family)